MITFTLVCNLGMSTSLLVDKMMEAAKARGLEVDVQAMPFDKVGADRIDKTDILLFGPQVRHLLKQFRQKYGEKIPVIESMNMQDYALLNANKILDESIAQLEQSASAEEE